MILFRDSGQTLLILDDFRVSRRTDDFRVSRRMDDFRTLNAGLPPPKREESFSRGPRSGGYGSERSSYGSERSGPSGHGSQRSGRSGYGSERSSYGSGSGSGSGSSDRVFVNLSWGVDDMALESLFGEQGNVVEARVIYDRDTGRSKGFGFVTLGSPQEVTNRAGPALVTKAINSLNGADLDGRLECRKQRLGHQGANFERLCILQILEVGTCLLTCLMSSKCAQQSGIFCRLKEFTV
ncbi:hypothetical protein F2Q69_00020933 [Brassica cretica]|uniref:RRM domain-containing protein n=1 Tax=Brassica cretica TaxID=69181 RepID=A0A8S9QTF1_BRACR|nr:hypothetical protein F2Q69_00020933 [Brassica cretica]